MNKTIATTWTERKAALKREIYNYFTKRGADKEVVIKAWASVKLWGEVQVQIAEMAAEPVTPTKPDEDFVVDSFRPEHRAIVASWINRYAELHALALEHLESQRNYGEKTRWGRDDFEHADWESTQPDGEIQIHSDHIKVFAFGFTEGFAERLPKQGKKSVGKTDDGGYEWHYPLSSLEALQKLGLPVLRAIDA
jgi:hypothetical protein